MATTNYNEPVWVDCLAAVHAQGTSITGTIAHLEGDLLEIRFTSEPVFELAAEVGLTVYARDGLLSFDTYVIGKLPKRLMLILPLKVQNQLFNRRKELRLPLEDVTGLLRGYTDCKRKAEAVFEQPVAIDVCDISLSGAKIGIPFPLPIAVGDRLTVLLNLDVPTPVTLEVKHKETVSEGVVQTGGQFQNIDPQTQSSIRACILKRQASLRPIQIREEAEQQQGSEPGTE